MSTLLHKRVWKSFLCVLNWQPGNWIERDVAVWVYSWNWTEWQLQPVRKRGRHLVLFTTPQLIWILWHMSVVFCSKHICQLLFLSIIDFLNETRNTLSNSGVCPMQLFHFWSRDVLTFIQFKIYCCVQNFIEIGWFFTEIWRYIDFQNGGRPPSWNCFTTIRDHPRSLCCWSQLLVKFHVNLIHISEDNSHRPYLAWNA